MSTSAQPLSDQGKMVGDYVLGRQIGSGSFSVVWHGRHRVNGTEVAIKEISTSRLIKKLKDSLTSEIFILKRINHPNIICLYDIIEVPGKINIVLEYCKGGDLSMYLQRHGKVSEPVARNFMKQLAAGLLILRNNNLIHRDLKPQNLLLSSSGNDSVLKIADFGFARPLQPRGLAETLCGSPLYMAPEIMQLQKYDAKADLWSVGAILFQLVTGKTPFTGNTQVQLLQNILKSNGLNFPPECNDLSSECKDLCQKLLRRNPVERLTFDEFFNHPFFSERKFESARSGTSPSTFHEVFSKSGSTRADDAEENTPEDCLPFKLDDVKKSLNPILTPLDIPAKKMISGMRQVQKSFGDDKRSLKGNEIETTIPASVTESTEMVDGYVIVSSPPNDPSSSSSSSRMKWKKSPKEKTVVSRAVTQGYIALESGVGDRPPLDEMGRLRSLRESASVVAEVVREEMIGGRRLEAFSILLVVLATLKEALNICDGSVRASGSKGEVMAQFKRELEYADIVTRGLEPNDTPMPEAMGVIFERAKAVGISGGVDELMGDLNKARARYEKAARLMFFLLEDGPSLKLNPPFRLNANDRTRLKTYISALSNRRLDCLHGSPP